MLANFVDGADVGVIQGRGGTGFAAETFERLRVVGEFVGQKLQGYEAAKLVVFGLVDHAHPAPAQLVDNAVVRDGLTDHGIGSC